MKKVKAAYTLAGTQGCETTHYYVFARKQDAEVALEAAIKLAPDIFWCNGFLPIYENSTQWLEDYANGRTGHE